MSTPETVPDPEAEETEAGETEQETPDAEQA
jgi:hypothetical protein